MLLITQGESTLVTCRKFYRLVVVNYKLQFIQKAKEISQKDVKLEKRERKSCNGKKS